MAIDALGYSHSQELKDFDFNIDFVSILASETSSIYTKGVPQTFPSQALLLESQAAHSPRYHQSRFSTISSNKNLCTLTPLPLAVTRPSFHLLHRPCLQTRYVSVLPLLYRLARHQRPLLPLSLPDTLISYVEVILAVHLVLLGSASLSTVVKANIVPAPSSPGQPQLGPQLVAP